MGIEQTTPNDEIDAYIQQHLERMERTIVKSLSYIGEKCVKQARDHAAFTDQTGNLRSSIGYVVIKEGVVVQESSFEQVKNGSEGVQSGKVFIHNVAAKFPRGIVLVVMAGMNYAASVEARNLNVLTSAELLAEQQIPRLMKKLGFTEN